MKNLRRVRPQLEMLEAKTLLSGLPTSGVSSSVGMVETAAAVVPAPLPLTGSFKGTYSGTEQSHVVSSSLFPPSLVVQFSADYKIIASGQIDKLKTFPKFTLTGKLDVSGKIDLAVLRVAGPLSGSATVTLHDTKGDITVLLTAKFNSVPRKVPNDLDFTYKLTGGTKAFAHTFDSGTGHIHRVGTSNPVTHSASGTFTLNFTSSHPKHP